MQEQFEFLSVASPAEQGSEQEQTAKRAPSNVGWQGWLWKESRGWQNGGNLLKRWQRRWFRLVEDTSGMFQTEQKLFLHSYTSNAANHLTVPRKIIIVDYNVDIQRHKDLDRAGKAFLSLAVKGNCGKLSTTDQRLVLASSTAEEADAVVECFNTIVDRVRNSDSARQAAAARAASAAAKLQRTQSRGARTMGYSFDRTPSAVSGARTLSAESSAASARTLSAATARTLSVESAARTLSVESAARTLSAEGARAGGDASRRSASGEFAAFRPAGSAESSGGGARAARR